MAHENQNTTTNKNATHPPRSLVCTANPESYWKHTHGRHERQRGRWKTTITGPGRFTVRTSATTQQCDRTRKHDQKCFSRCHKDKTHKNRQHND